MTQYFSQFIIRSGKYQRICDEEQEAGGPPPQRSKRGRRFTRLSRTGAWLFLADLVIFGLLLSFIWPLISLLRYNKQLFPISVNVTSDGSLDAFRITERPQIPRILHQTVKNDTIPSIWVDAQNSCRKVYSEFDYMLWTDERAREFLSTEYPWFLETWDNYPFPIQRADAIRYFVLYHYGGMYLDMDTVCHEPFPLHQIESDTLAHNFLFEATLPTGVTNDIMVSSARHPAFSSAIRILPVSYHITRFWARLVPYAAIMGSTGPLFISLAVAKYLYEEPLLPSPTVQVIHPSCLKPYISNLQTAT
ncbi:hypothetical protein LCI18_006872 [Fusarium solani-melongenae]|uniref:Uncharacterized protein n=1 Tax=Fusarium solani subsp. cucurbitae TaxID=2747967 RepID=A0ACD3Z444_FUSSC|nr:hypothetical protein LCI18_006872 [Fusarium solani-melongenae]